MRRKIFCVGAWLLLFSMIIGRAESAQPMAEWINWPDSEIHPAKGTVCGMAVDRTTGDLFVVVNPYHAELWKSMDQGETFASKGTLGGLPINSYSFCADPAGKRLACFFAYPDGGGMVTDGGATLAKFSTIAPTGSVPPITIDIPKVNRNCFECGVVDWEATGKACMGMTHETHGVLVLSTDSGSTWKVLGTGFTLPVGIFDPQTLLVGNHSLQRSTDGGVTWTKVCDLPKTSLSAAYSAEGTAIIVYKGAGYLLTENGLLVTRDKGATWKAMGAPINVCSAPNKFRVSGPFFGADENHILLVGMDGVFLTVNGGANWKKVASYPSDDPGFPVHSCFAWDPVHNIVYAARSGKPALVCRLPSP